MLLPFRLPTLRSVRNYYKPRRSEAFFDVEGVVTKDTLLFRYDDEKKVRRKGLLGLFMLPLHGYLGYFAFGLRKLDSLKEVDEKLEYNLRFQNVLQASTVVGAFFCMFGIGLSSYWVTRTVNTVRRLILRKGGKYVGIQTYGLLGRNDKFVNVPVVHCSGIQRKFYGRFTFFLKVRDHNFKYSFNLEDGVFTNKPLFDRTVGVSRVF